MNDTLLAILACPLCKGSLLYNKEEQELVCTKDRIAYPIKNKIPIMVVSKARKLACDKHKQNEQ